MSVAAPPAAPHAARRAGVVYGLAAYGWWGFVALYFHAVGAAGPLEILAHRIAWSCAFLLVLALRDRGGAALRAVLHAPRTLGVLAVTTLLIAINWLVFIWAVNNGAVLESSLGYYINPLVNVLLGTLVLRERLSRAALAAVALATCGVLWIVVPLGRPPWIALALAASFGLYGLLRKTAAVGALAGLTVETLMLLPAALGYLGWRLAHGTLVFGRVSRGFDVLLACSGIVTAVPLLWFARAARRLPLSTMGFLQFLAPSLQFALAVTVFGEPFGGGKAVAFAFIWAACAVFAVSTLRTARAQGAKTTPAPS